MRELLPLRDMLQEVRHRLKLDFTKPTILYSTIFENNNGALGLAQSSRMTSRTKCILVKYYFFRSHIRIDNETDTSVILEEIDTKD